MFLATDHTIQPIYIFFFVTLNLQMFLDNLQLTVDFKYLDLQ